MRRFLSFVGELLCRIFNENDADCVKINGIGNTVHQKKVNVGLSGRVAIVLVILLIIGIITPIYLLTRGTPHIDNGDVTCKSCAVDPHRTEKMLAEIRHDPDMAIDIARRSNIDLTRVPDGYFVLFQRIDPLLSDIIDKKLGDVVGIRPDLSVDKRFRIEARKYYPDLYAKRKQCRQMYINQNTTRAKKLPLTCYPMEMAPIFDRFFRNVYQELYQQTYIENIKRDKIKLIQEARDARDAKEEAKEPHKN